MSWRAITEDDVYSALNDAEGTALRAQVLRPGQEDPLNVVIGQVVSYARDAIRSHAGNVLSPTATELPEGSIPAAVDLIIARLALRMSRALSITEGRQDARDQAQRYFEMIAKGQMAVEQYGDTPDATNSGGGHLEQITPDRRRADREGLKGL